MATTVGAVEIELRARMEKLQSDITSGKNIVSKGMKDIQGAASALQGYMGALGVGAFANYVKGAVDAAGAIADLSQKTGASAEVLSSLEYAAKMSGTTLDGVAKGLQKLATNMYDTAQGTGEARNAFKTLGISVTDSNGQLKSTDAVLLEVADQFADMKDGTEKAALAVKLFGKSGVELIPLLNEGAGGIQAMQQRAEELGLTISDKTASAMEALGDKFDTVGMASQGTARQIAAGLTPALTVVADAFLDATKGGGMLSGAIQVLVGFLKGVISVGFGVAAVFDQVGMALGALAAAVMNPSQAIEILKQNEKDAAESSEKWGKKIAAVWDDNTAAIVKTTDVQKTHTPVRKADAAEAEKQAKKIEDVNKKLDDEILMLKLTSIEAAIYKEQVKAGVKANSDAGKEIADKVRELEREKVLTDIAKDAVKSYNDMVKAQDDANNAATKTLLEKLQKAKDENEQFGLSKSGIEELTLKRMQEREEMYKGWVAKGINVEWAQKELDAVRDQIEIQQEYVDELKKGEAATQQKKNADDSLKAWQDVAKDIEKALTDSLMRGFDSGKDMITSLRDYIVNAFKSMVIKMAVQPIMGAVTSGLGLLSGNSAMAADGAAKTASGMSSIMSTVSTISTMAGAFGSSLAAGFTSTIASFGATTGLAIEGGMAAIASGTSASIAAGLGQIIGTLGPYALAAVAVYGLLGGFKGTYVTGKSKNANYDAEGNLTGTSVRQWDRVSDGGKEFEDFLGGIANTYQQMAKGLGIKTGALGLGFETNTSEGGKYGFAAALNGKNVLEVGETKITEGAIALTASRAVFAALQASELPTYLAGIFDGMAASAMTQEQLNAALQTAQAYQALHTTLVSLPMANLRDLSYQAASGLVAAAGGMDKLISGLQSYYDLYYNADEKSVVTANSIANSLAAVGIDGSKLSTREDFRALFESVDASTAAGQQQMAALLQVAPTFATLSDYLTEQEKSLGDLTTITPQLTLLTEATTAADTAAATAADATTAAIESTTTAVNAGTSAVVAAVTGSSSTIASAISGALTSAAATSAAAVAAASASATAAANASAAVISSRLAAIESSNSLIASAP